VSITLSNEFLGLAQGSIDHNASSIINAVCGNTSLVIGDVVRILPKGTGVGFTQDGDLLPRVGKVNSFATEGYGIVVGGDFEGIYSDGVINLDSNSLALGLVVAFFGDSVRVCTQGRCLALVDGFGTGSINVGDALTTAVAGLVKASDGNIVIANALQPASKANSIIAVDIKRQGKTPGESTAFKKELTVDASDVSISIPTDWFDTDFKRRISITINSGQVLPLATGQANYPFLFNSTITDFIGNTQVNGEDFRFVLEDKTVLDYEIEKYDNTTGELTAWAKFVSPIKDGTKFFIYYDNDAASDAQDSPAVWSDYNAVYHLNQTTFGANSTVDSTGNNNNGTPQNMDLTNSITGQIDGALDFNEGGTNNEVIEVPSNATLNPGQGAWSVSGWVNPDNLRRMDFVGNQEQGGSFDGWSLRANNLVDTGRPMMIFRASNATCMRVETADTTLVVGVLTHIAFTFPGGTLNAGEVKVFINGDSVTPSIITNALNAPVANNIVLNIVASGDNGAGPQFWEGIVDEVHISADVKTPDFIKTEFNNQDNTLTFYTLGSPVIIESFPLLVSITDTDLRDNARADGFDIFFTKSDGITVIPYDREKYDSTTGELVAWVLTDLTNTADNKFFMFYGNPNATDQQNPSAVWNPTSDPTRFNDVYHFNETVFPYNNSSVGEDFDVLPAAGEPSTIGGQIDTSVFIDEKDVIMETPTGSAVTNDDYFITAWVKLDVLGTGASFFNFYDTNFPNPLNTSVLFIGTGVEAQNANDKVLAFFRNNTPPLADLDILIGDISDLAFHHIAIRYTLSTTTVDLFFDGAFVSATSFTPDFPILFDVARCGGGAIGAPNFASGRVDEVRVAYNSNFTDGFVKTSFDNQKDGDGNQGQGAGNFVKVGPQQPT